jgi:hypothetical protein
MSESDLANTMRNVLREASFQPERQSGVNTTACIVVVGVLVLLICVGMFMSSTSPKAMSYIRKLKKKILPKRKKLLKKSRKSSQPKRPRRKTNLKTKKSGPMRKTNGFNTTAQRKRPVRRTRLTSSRFQAMGSSGSGPLQYSQSQTAQATANPSTPLYSADEIASGINALQRQTNVITSVPSQNYVDPIVANRGGIYQIGQTRAANMDLSGHYPQDLSMKTNNYS